MVLFIYFMGLFGLPLSLFGLPLSLVSKTTSFTVYGYGQ